MVKETCFTYWAKDISSKCYFFLNSLLTTISFMFKLLISLQTSPMFPLPFLIFGSPLALRITCFLSSLVRSEVVDELHVGTAEISRRGHNVPDEEMMWSFYHLSKAPDDAWIQGPQHCPTSRFPGVILNAV